MTKSSNIQQNKTKKYYKNIIKIECAPVGNRTRVSSVARMHSTTKPQALQLKLICC